MHGSLSVTSTVDVGATFTVELKRAPSAMASAPTGSIGSKPAPPVRILYIEDNVDNFKLVDRVLRQRPNSTLIPAIRGTLGIDLACEHQPDLILLGLHLPDMSGLEVLRVLRANRATRDIPILVLTADTTAGVRAQLLEEGARLVLTKPFDLGTLLTVIDEAATR
jgi:CheY-like chemotaxis protein